MAHVFSRPVTVVQGLSNLLQLALQGSITLHHQNPEMHHWVRLRSRCELGHLQKLAPVSGSSASLVDNRRSGSIELRAASSWMSRQTADTHVDVQQTRRHTYTWTQHINVHMGKARTVSACISVACPMSQMDVDGFVYHVVSVHLGVVVCMPRVSGARTTYVACR
jgi:hypothetical protein